MFLRPAAHQGHQTSTILPSSGAHTHPPNADANAQPAIVMNEEMPLADWRLLTQYGRLCPAGGGQQQHISGMTRATGVVELKKPKTKTAVDMAVACCQSLWEAARWQTVFETVEVAINGQGNIHSR